MEGASKAHGFQRFDFMCAVLLNGANGKNTQTPNESCPKGQGTQTRPCLLKKLDRHMHVFTINRFWKN
jgi:hypothetical protein